MVLIALMAALSGCLPAPAFEFVFVPGRSVGVMNADDTISVGYFDARGDFRQTGVERLGHRSGPMTWQLVCSGSPVPELAYELRNGSLVPGTRSAFDRFTPTPGAVIIRLADYRYSEAAPKIWNLPGYFKRVGEPTTRPEIWTPVDRPTTK